jgi:hypothetical protein
MCKDKKPLEKAFRAVKVCIEKKALVLPPLRAGSFRNASTRSVAQT